MIKIARIATAVLLLVAVLPVAHAGCGPTPQPAFAIPDGAHASQDEMSAARGNLSAYSAQVAAYAACLEAEQAGSGRANRKTQRLRTRDLVLTSAALARLAAVMSCFSRQVRAFEASGGGRDAGAAQCSRAATRSAGPSGRAW
jgi:hypothetical protein